MELCDLRPIQDAATVFASCKIVHTLISSCFCMCLVLFSLHEYPNAVLKSLRTVGVFSFWKSGHCKGFCKSISFLCWTLIAPEELAFSDTCPPLKPCPKDLIFYNNFRLIMLNMFLQNAKGQSTWHTSSIKFPIDTFN